MFTQTSTRDNKLPKPFDVLKVIGEISNERYGGKESLSPGTRVIKGPSYDQSKKNAVEGNYIGTVLPVKAEVKNEDEERSGSSSTELEGAQEIEQSATSSTSTGNDQKHASNTVDVYWDNGKKDTCDIGPNKFELQLYERSNVIREDDTKCDGCNEYPLHGIRWKCITCNSTNLCTACYMADQENRNHIYQRLITNGIKGLDMPSRSSSAKNGKRKEVRGIILGSKVDLPNDNMQGTVVGFVKGSVYRYIFRDTGNCDKEINSKTIQRRYDDSKKIQIQEKPDEILPVLTREMIEKLPEIRVIIREGSNYIAGTMVSYKETDDDKSKLKIRIHWDARWDFVKRKIYNVPNSSDHNALYVLEHGGSPINTFKEGKRETSTPQESEAECSSDINNQSEGGADLYIFEEGDRIKGIRWKDRRHLCFGSCNQQEDPEVVIKKIPYIRPVLVKNQDGEIFLRDISEMKLQKSQNNDRATTFYYQDHLPILGEDEIKHIVANVETENKLQEIQVQISQKGDSVSDEFSTSKKGDSESDETTFRPSLLYILPKDNQQHKFQEMTSSPCHLVNEKILLGKGLKGENKACGVHKSTPADVVKELVQKGYTIFKQKEMQDEEDNLKDNLQIEYFMEMAEHIMGEKMLPVIIISRGLTEEISQKAKDLTIPVIYIETSTSVCVSWNWENSKQNSPENHSNRLYKVDFQQPWVITRLDSLKEFQKPSNKDESFFDSKQNLEDFDLQISSVLTGVIVHILKDKAHNQSPGKDNSDLGKKISLYVTSLPVQLLKAGRWNFPGSFVMDTLDKIFNQKSIQYIFEKNMEEEFNSGLWEDLKEKTDSAYQPPKWTEKRKLEVDKSCSISDLVFYALLKTKRLDGARQLLESGCVGIRPILIGCKILKDFSENWRVEILEENELNGLRRMFGRHALSIMNYIYEKDERDKPDDPSSLSDKVMTFLFKKNDEVNNAGRLLLNHGYLDVAYKTENEWFLENSKLKTIIKELWNGKGYKKNRGPWALITTFILFVLHVFIMPLLLVNLDKPPLTWFYKKYHTPILKLWINMVGVFFFLAAFAYMLLFDYSEESVSSSEFAVLFWIACKFVDEIEQIIVTIKRRSKVPNALKTYLADVWNHLDWLIIIACILGAVLKWFDNDFMEDAAKLLYISAYVMLNIRILNMFWTSEFLGTQLVIIQKMLGNTLAFMAILLVIMMCYNVVDHALLFPNTEFSWAEVERIIKNGYWTLYGNFEDDVGIDCTNNATVYKAGLQERCPTSLGTAISPYLRAIYCLIAVVMLLNLLIAIYSYTASMVHTNSRMHWSQLQSNFLEEYTIRNIFPIHFKLLSAAAFVVHLVISPLLKCLTNKKGQPAYERVLLYDEKYDILQKDTMEAEKNGILEMQGKLVLHSDHHSQLASLKQEVKEEMKEVKNEVKELKNVMEDLKNDIKKLLNQKETTTL